jgi:hypothetical protein
MKNTAKITQKPSAAVTNGERFVAQPGDFKIVGKVLIDPKDKKVAGKKS